MLVKTVSTLIGRTFSEIRLCIEELEFQLDWLQRQVFSAESERFLPSSDVQMALDLGVATRREHPFCNTIYRTHHCLIIRVLKFPFL